MSRSAGEQERDVAAFRDLQKVGAEEGEVDHTQHAGELGNRGASRQ
jgi:hypothetical protein